MIKTKKDISEEVIVLCSRDERGSKVFKTTLTPRSDQRLKAILTSIPAPIPIVFLPGIMGSNLRDKASGEPVWRPPNASFWPGDIRNTIVALYTWWRRGPAERQKLLNADIVEVDNRGSIDTGRSELSEEAAQYRGWGSVIRSSYHPPVALFEDRLDNILLQREFQPWWSEHGKANPADYGEELGQARPLKRSELVNACKYQFDVWCAGYNWLQSNEKSAADIKAYIENTVIAHYRDHGGITAEQATAMKVILVTHSMGGLVARALTQFHGYERVLGVVHGVQPATGAPAIYHHMRCGYEGASQIILGANAGEVTAVVARSPGALELVPSADHRGGKPWLFLREDDGKVRRAYPSAKDPYEEIYKSAAWYGLVPAQNSQYLDMTQTEGKNTKKSARTAFRERIDAVAKFHQELSAGSYHPQTYVHYGADDLSHSWRDVNWVGDPTELETPGSACEDNGNGSYNGWLRHIGYREGLPDISATRDHWRSTEDRDGSGGDGTVPTDAGQAPAKTGIRASFRHGNKGRGQYNTAPGYDHQNSYLDERAQWATLYSIIKLAQLADWHPSDEGVSET